jgi:hypothetical protein
MRTRQLQKKDENMNEAKNLLKRMRKQDKKYFNSKHFTTIKNINKNDLVFFHNTQHEMIEALIASLNINNEDRFELKKLFKIRKFIFCKSLTKLI